MTTQVKPQVGEVGASYIELRRFTVGEYRAMAKAGILKREERVELLDGVIVKMAPIGNRHMAAVDRYNHSLVLQVGERAIVRVQGSIVLDDGTMPEPDLVLLRPREDFYASSSAGSDDALLVIEVADSSVEYDRNEKLPRYARAGIPEAWLTVLPESLVEVHTEPTDGGYRVTRRFRPGDILSPQCFPDIEIPVDAVVPS